MTNITDEQIREHLAKTGRIAIIWGIEDVKAIRPDLTDEQCDEVRAHARTSTTPTLGSPGTLSTAMPHGFSPALHPKNRSETRKGKPNHDHDR